MYELSVAFKYLVPRWRQLSVSIISLISIFVIALVVWLIVVFFSVTQGLEKSWIQKLIALTAPIRVSPTEHYYNSYYYLVDSISTNSNYTQKTIGEKLAAPQTDPYNADFDQEAPLHWISPDLDVGGNLKDPVKLAFATIQQTQDIPGLAASEYEMTVTNLKLKLAHDKKGDSTLSQATYLGSYDPQNPNLAKAMLPVTADDIQNVVAMNLADSSGPSEGLRLKKIFNTIDIQSFRASEEGVAINAGFIPENCNLKVCALKVGKKINSVIIPPNANTIGEYTNRSYNERITPFAAQLTKKDGKVALSSPEGEEIALGDQTLILSGQGDILNGKVDVFDLEKTHRLADIPIDIKMKIQGAELSGKIRWNELQVDTFDLSDNKNEGFWLFKNSIPTSLPSDSLVGDAILLPKSYRAAGVLIGDRGQLTYQTPTATSIQEQRLPIYVAGFYDPGILPLGGKIILANQYIVSMIRSAYPNDQSPLSNGINVRIDNLDDAPMVKNMLESAFAKAGIDKYWKVETYREFDFTKDFLQQLRSERNLFTLISTIVILVACANIVSMLIILVNNKKMEIGILRSMGATSQSIALIFGLCGMVMGLAGSAIGLAAALVTLKNLQTLINFISRLQGFDAFNPVFYGDSLPNEISVEVLVFVVGGTVFTSLIAGVIPAVKASVMRPSAILRSE